MRIQILTKIIGTQWRTFCGVSRDDFLALTMTVLEREGCEYDTETFDPTSGEKVMFGSEDDNKRIRIDTPVEFEIDVISATADPLARFGLGFVLGEERRRDATADLCIVTIRELDANTRPYIAHIVSHVIDEADRPPWDVAHHISFQLAVLLRLKIRILWKYWLYVYDSTEYTAPSSD